MFLTRQTISIEFYCCSLSLKNGFSKNILKKTHRSRRLRRPFEEQSRWKACAPGARDICRPLEAKAAARRHQTRSPCRRAPVGSPVDSGNWDGIRNRTMKKIGFLKRWKRGAEDPSGR
ncbi:unnamed protein product [Nesidiocoris tenuis]|uniref:Uncharacterized protein n=1 Tax=Nesidiocoris tenuis TaxID=355587 RepID=A0A6H5G0W3_9HEMI|nr:unnamed protein product [Nesidiocoris tenuis]